MQQKILKNETGKDKTSVPFSELLDPVLAAAAK